MEELKKFFQKAFQTHLSHSYLLKGTLQKEEIENFLKWLINKLCLEKGGDPKRAFKFETLIIGPDQKGKIGIDEIRKLKDFLRLKPVYGFYKILLLKEAHRMTPQAANALLKTLEEPQGKAIIFLITQRPERLPRTIVSRTVSLKLKEKEELEEAKDLEMAEFLKILSQAKIEQLFSLAKKLSSNESQEIQAFLEKWLVLLRARLREQTGKNSQKIVSLIKKIKETKELLGNTALNSQLALEGLFLEAAADKT